MLGVNVVVILLLPMKILLSQNRWVMERKTEAKCFHIQQTVQMLGHRDKRPISWKSDENSSHQIELCRTRNKRQPAKPWPLVRRAEKILLILKGWMTRSDCTTREETNQRYRRWKAQENIRICKHVIERDSSKLVSLGWYWIYVYLRGKTGWTYLDVAKSIGRAKGEI